VLNAGLKFPNNARREGLRVEPADDRLKVFITELVTGLLLLGLSFLVVHLKSPFNLRRRTSPRRKLLRELRDRRSDKPWVALSGTIAVRMVCRTSVAGGFC
jgi:hypothetical protein